ncbi:efflux RND transporter periplasmic adaptor subunit [Dehalobacterium formicoaceticum]|uniref:Efflux RND transporter periplasmic adaptor subunit n=1 Tax=Dehalobacterium formicoaceticum TaxID=51515 RepID=A0ABT1Y0D1_9FIRM|nr:HlyD family efflux transporter periplasmic adaptor subunit [Dehalobacterium formicoaceticum]MCR6544305.1 efflux RND transporter periplasmic adaptor subunit [Dehalobacterium formicoaceticum]
MKKYRFLIIFMVVAICAAVGYFFINREEGMEVSTMKGYKGSISKTIEVSGVIDSNDIQVIPLEANRKVIKTYVQENDLVKENQLLAELDTTDIDLSLKKAKANLEDLNAKLSHLTSDKSSVILLSNALSKSREEYALAKTDLQTAQDDLKRAELLYGQNAISKVEYDKYVSDVNKLTANVKKAELSLNDASVSFSNNDKENQQSISSLERQIRTAQLDMESLHNEIKDSGIYSSTAGFVTEFPLEAFHQILAGESITIYGNATYEFAALVPQQDATLIKEGLKAMVAIDGLSNAYEGIVTTVSKNAVTDNSGSEPKVEIRIEITNPDDAILFGYEGKANIILAEQDEVLILKNECVKNDDNGEFVYVVEGKAAQKVYVETGITDGYVINIKKGISENDVVIINPPLDLTKGMLVKVMK